MKKEKRIFGKALMILSLLFFYIPILYMIVFSFNSGRSLTNFEGFSLTWYEHVQKPRYDGIALYHNNYSFNCDAHCYFIRYYKRNRIIKKSKIFKELCFTVK